MSKNKTLLFLSCLMIGYIFLPVVFRNIPIPRLGEGIYLLYIIGLLVFAPKMFLSKQMLIVYSFIILYYFLAPTDSANPESKWLEGRVLNLFIAISLYCYFFYFSRDFKGMRIIFWFTFTAIVISCITTSVGLERFPEASRELASSVYGDLEMTDYYKKIGILGYGFISALAYFIPIIVLLFQKQNWNYRKIVFLFAGIIASFAVIKAQYTTQFLFFSLSLLISWFGVVFYKKYNLLIFIPAIIIIFIPQETYINIVNWIANIVPGEILQSRLMDIANTVDTDELVGAGTHVASRYERIPFLISEFLKNPLLGGGESTGHVFWLDHLSLYGIIGIIPWLVLLRDNYNRVKVILKYNFHYYQIALIMFILIGFMKGSGSKEQLIFLFFLLPMGLFLFENELLFKKKITSYA